MIKSMTGYGKAEYIFSDHKTIVEIRSLNSKQLDLTLKTAPLYRDKENDIRRLLSAPLERGKVDVTVSCQQSAISNQQLDINWDAYQGYLDEYSKRYGEVPAEVRAAILRFPDVMKQADTAETLSDEEWTMLQEALQRALEAFDAFRIQEGAALEAMFTEKLNGIETLLAEVEPYEKNRVENIKQHLLKNLEKLAEETKQQVDRNRLEAELIYYLEKLDITEEKVRLVSGFRFSGGRCG